ncbi:MAG: Hsp20/alpha crystallin family protein [Pseudomonadota bacterium]
MTRKKSPQKPTGNVLDELTLGLSNLLDTFNDTLSDVSQRLENGQSGEVRRNFDLQTSNGPVRAEAGIKVKFADVGQTEFVEPKSSSVGQRSQGGMRQSSGPSGSASGKKLRSIEFEVLEDPDCWRLVADIPGAEKQDVTMHAENGELVIETTGTRRFRGRCTLPDGLTPSDLEVTLRNGILELIGRKPGAVSE